MTGRVTDVLVGFVWRRFTVNVNVSVGNWFTLRHTECHINVSQLIDSAKMHALSQQLQTQRIYLFILFIYLVWCNDSIHTNHAKAYNSTNRHANTIKSTLSTEWCITVHCNIQKINKNIETVDRAERNETWLRSLLYSSRLKEERQLKSSSHADKVFHQWMTLWERSTCTHLSWLGDVLLVAVPTHHICFTQQDPGWSETLIPTYPGCLETGH